VVAELAADKAASPTAADFVLVSPEVAESKSESATVRVDL
jgi:hypothetical protein